MCKAGNKIDASCRAEPTSTFGGLDGGYFQTATELFYKSYSVPSVFGNILMQASRPAQRICDSCSSQLFFLFRHGFCTPARYLPRARREAWRISTPQTLQIRSLTKGKAKRQFDVQPEATIEERSPKTVAQMEAIVYQARQTFGETLPIDFLSAEEYKIYERLYGAPTDTTKPEDIGLLRPEHGEPIEEPSAEKNLLFREDTEGNLEEVEYFQDELKQDEFIKDVEGMEEAEEEELDLEGDPRHNQSTDFKARVALFRDIAAANRETSTDPNPAENNVAEDNFKESHRIIDAVEDVGEQTGEGAKQDQREEEDLEDEEEAEEEDEFVSGDAARTHPLTAAARSRTTPATLQIHKTRIVEPVTAILRDASNKHLTEIAQKTFGGVGLPNSTATPSTAGRHLQQAPIALEASQKYMGEMEGNVYLAAIMPGAYAAVMSTLVETRKRIGSEWLRSLLRKEGGPRILDAGAAGAGVQAWREVLRAEWKSMHPDGVPEGKPAPLGKATVVTGSNVLRHKASRLLENTTFLPRLPDYNPERDHPTLGKPNLVQPRKQYDVIVAPHTLWGLKEDYMRKNQIQNFWSLLNPAGGVLVIIEKGVPRGFELVAGAREMLLNRHIASSDLSDNANATSIEEDSQYGPKEKGMIIAPCTNHGRCPMYTIPGQSKGRKDLCHFTQRFIRPPYLQRILGFKDRNHEDIRFSYVAVQRGVDHRQTQGILQGPQATAAALTGYEDAPEGSSGKPSPHMLSLPRTVLPPIKRRGHVILDLCTPAGRIERWTVPKSFSRQAYRDARKSSWGDLWALGAKTAIARNIRLGTKTKNVKGKSVHEVDPRTDDTDDKNHVGLNAKFEKRTKKGRTQKQRKKVIVDDF